ncbi:MAG: ornithine cyclodeaminase family protein [Marinilabiliales bacterium]|nr:MAG: ornithine cyclodeaminase family protein [Marinilabiliales bacterium]
MSEQNFQDIKILSESDIKGLLNMGDAINAMESAFSSFSEGSTYVPQRSVSSINDLNLFLKPAYNEKLGRICVKILTQKKEAKPGIPTILGVVLLMDMKTGAILSMMDGASITALRTGAASGIATKLLAAENSDTMAVFGCGTQGKTQVEAVCNVRPIKRALLYDLNTDAAVKLKREIEEKENISVEVVNSPEYLYDVNIICTATNSKNPLFSWNDITKGTHINAIGSYKPEMQEIDPEIIKNGNLFVDSKESVLKESGDLIKPINENIFDESVIIGEIGELINNKINGRRDDNEITIFKSVGLGVQDLFMANMIYEKYSQQ